MGGNTEAFDYLCIAAGRAPDVEGLGLDAAGVKPDEGGLLDVDEHMRTSADGVYAIGDIVHGPALAHKASDEGIIAVEDAAGLDDPSALLRRHPGATFCYPQVASFGLTEARGEGARGRRRGREVPDGRRRRGDRLRRPQGHGQDGRRRDATASCSAPTSSARAPRR